MLYEKKKLLLYRVVCGCLFLLSVIIPVIIFTLPPSDINLIDDSGYLVNYWDYIDESECEIEIFFDGNVDSGSLLAEFFDSDGYSLGVYTEEFFAFDNSASVTFFVDGYVDSYNIVNCYYNVYDDNYIGIVWSVFIGLFMLLLFVSSLLLSCKVYDLYGHEIIVYAGCYHHYIKIDGELYDEHNTLTSFSPIYMSCALGDDYFIEATISLWNRISLKVNNKLYLVYKK